MLQKLLMLSSSINDVSAIQGAGGNASVKYKDRMWIKASGTVLSEMTKDTGWTVIDIFSWNIDFYNFIGNNEDKFILLNEKHTIATQRASIETGLHALLPHTYVFHTHSCYANFLLCSQQSQVLEKYLLEEKVNVITVPMAAPGLQLTQLLASQIDHTTSQESTVVLLENHGVAVASNNLTEIIRLHKIVHESLQHHFELPHFIPPKLENDFRWDAHMYKEALYQYNRNPITLFPDQVVYVDNKIDKHIFVEEHTVFFKNLSLRSAQNTAEIMASMLYLLQYCCNIKGLPGELCSYIANMSGEKYRQNLES